MKELLNQLRSEFIERLNAIESTEDLEDLRVKYLGKKGLMTEALKGMGKLSKEERPVIGKLANEISDEMKEALVERKEKFQEALLRERLKREIIDISLEKEDIDLGHDHPLIKTMDELEDLFVSMGFKIIAGPEIESVENNFDLLNSPEDHPSRDMSDTFYIDEKTLLRTHTSPVQIRTKIGRAHV